MDTLKAALLGCTACTPIEIWWQDEARVGQKGSLAYVWAPVGSRPAMVRDNRHSSAVKAWIRPDGQCPI